ncbi:MAG: hypothetical protein AAGE84_08205 [Cyanobacteria bacterium P01_G01_bin.39]
MKQAYLPTNRHPKAYDSQKLNNGRWGIFINNELVATIGCPDTCQKIVHFLETRLSQQQVSNSKRSKRASQYFLDLKLKP